MYSQQYPHEVFYYNSIPVTCVPLKFADRSCKLVFTIIYGHQNKNVNGEARSNWPFGKICPQIKTKVANGETRGKWPFGKICPQIKTKATNGK